MTGLSPTLNSNGNTKKVRSERLACFVVINLVTSSDRFLVEGSLLTRMYPFFAWFSPLDLNRGIDW